jgi:flavin reductase (DIM6/NTAB) family NADH-FMN oxidoreductase RutF
VRLQRGTIRERRVAVRPEQFIKALGQWPSGVTVVTTVTSGEPSDDAPTRWGLTASSFASVSLHPPLVSVCIATAAGTHDRIVASGIFGVSVLSADHVDVGKRFAGAMSAQDRFEVAEWVTAETGSPLLADAQAWLDCRVTAAHPAGDHTIFVGEVLACDTPRPRAPLLYHARAWGQFADVLPERVTLRPAGAGAPAVVHVGASPHTVVEDAADQIAAAVAQGSDEICLVDATGELSPLDVRALLQAAVPVASGRPLWLRASDRLGFGSANILTALKSGVSRFEVAPGQGADDASGIPAALVTALCARMGIAIAADETIAVPAPV